MLVNIDKVIETLQSHKGSFAEVRNPAYIYPPIEYYPLAQPLLKVSQLRAALMDMDGTTTTTEVLCIYSLENMVRRMAGKPSKTDWEGVDHEKDLANIIGNSTTKHVEYLLTKYGYLIDSKYIASEFLLAAQWTLLHGNDKQRQAEVVQNLKKQNLALAVEDIYSGLAANDLLEKWVDQIHVADINTSVSLGIDIYYETYHRILALLKEGKSDAVRQMVFGRADSGENLISPMPGITLLIPLLKGWLGNEAVLIADQTILDYEKHVKRKFSEQEKIDFRLKINQSGLFFEKNPVKLGLVTSSIFYEADIVIREIMKVLGHDIAASSLSDQKKKFILDNLEDYHHVYDAFVTASDSSEIRLKPHRDLYSMALHQIGVLPADFDKVVGFEDSQSGTVAIRAAGIGCCVAVPFAQTSNHNFEAATHVLHGGVPQAIFEHNLFLDV